MVNKKILAAPLLAISLMLGCNYFRTDVNKYLVNVKFDGGANEEKLEKVSVIIGADKFWWSYFEEGEEKSVTLFSDKNAVNNLTLLYTFGGNERSWESADFAEDTGYRINITVNSLGKVSEVFCKLPCQ